MLIHSYITYSSSRDPSVAHYVRPACWYIALPGCHHRVAHWLPCNVVHMRTFWCNYFESAQLKRLCFKSEVMIFSPYGLQDWMFKLHIQGRWDTVELWTACINEHSKANNQKLTSYRSRIAMGTGVLTVQNLFGWSVEPPVFWVVVQPSLHCGRSLTQQL